MRADDIDRPWTPMPPRDVARFFRRFPGRWWIAGGWALDLWLGHPTRLHEDTDVLILRRDLGHVHDTLPGWVMMAADPPGSLRPWHAGEPLPDHVHDIWCRREQSDTWEFQFMVIDSVDDRWLFRRDHRVSGPVDDLGLRRDGIPILAPEVQLLYKARAPHREKDAADLQRMIPHMPGARRIWLRDRVRLLYPDSPALDLLDRPSGMQAAHHCIQSAHG